MNKAFWITAVAGLLWTVIGLRDIFAPHFLRFDGGNAANITIILDFVVAALFLSAAFIFRRASSSGLHRKL